MKEQILEKVIKCIRTLNSISVPVGLYDQIAAPIMMTVNELGEIREQLTKREDETKDAEG